MQCETLIMMIVTLGVTWGGFGYFIWVSIRREKEKKNQS
ncbi:MAG: MetS family NSS transporter small subunit [Thermodesulfobacteriota bacterium]|nr:MetS family NSS transporter small subunit [Thermodesulfobacteriota bacterium]